MTEQEWVIVATAFTGLFDIVKEKAPERIQIDRVFTAGRILAMEIERIRAKRVSYERASVLGLLSMPSFPNTTYTGMRRDNLQKHNEEVEKKKQVQREELNDLTDTLKASIENAEKDRQGE
jgi:hypothetical protein